MLALLIWACTQEPASDLPPPVEAAAASHWIEDMWRQRALTVSAGLDEAQQMLANEEKDKAAEHVMAVYRGAFEPELEPLIREQVSPQVAVELEYGFGLMREAMLKGNRTQAKERIEAFNATLEPAAAHLDELKAVLR